MISKPEKLKKGDEVRVVAPARSLKLIGAETREIAEKRFADLGLKLTFGKHTLEENADMFFSDSIENRVEDVMEAFADKNVKAIFTVIGGFNSNQLLDYLDYDIIAKNPKIFCGFSDITAIANAIHEKGNMIVYYGPHFSSFGMLKGFEYTLENAVKMLMEDGVVECEPSKEWSDDPWYRDQQNRDMIKNEGWWLIHDGKAKGVIEGGNLCTYILLNGTSYRHKFTEDTILFLEDDEISTAVEVDRNLQAVIQQPDFHHVKGLVIGRFQKASNITREQLEYVINTKKELKNIPVIANVDFGHTTPILTIPFGGNAELEGKKLKIIG